MPLQPMPKEKGLPQSKSKEINTLKCNATAGALVSWRLEDSHRNKVNFNGVYGCGPCECDSLRSQVDPPQATVAR